MRREIMRSINATTHSKSANERRQTGALAGRALQRQIDERRRYRSDDREATTSARSRQCDEATTRDVNQSDRQLEPMTTTSARRHDDDKRYPRKSRGFGLSLAVANGKVSARGRRPSPCGAGACTLFGEQASDKRDSGAGA